MLFKQMSDVLPYAGVATNVNFTSISGTILNVERWHVVPILGNALYSDLNSAYALITLETSLTTAQQELLAVCRNVIGSYLCYYYAPKAELLLSDAGARRMETDQAKTAFQYQVTNFREQHLLEAERHSEGLLEFLDANQSSYPEWVASKSFAQYRKMFIKTAGEFNENYTTSSPYRNYWAMRFKMVDVEAQLITPALSAPLFAALKTKDETAPGTFTDEETQLLLYIKKAIAYYTVSYALPYVAVRFDANGITVTSEQGKTSNDNLNKLGDAGDTKISNLIRKCTEDGRQWLKTAMDYINANLTAFPTYVPPKKPLYEEKHKQWDLEEELGIDLWNANLDSSFGLV